MIGDPFSALGLDGPRDLATVRRRYAELLRQHRPDDDPEAFARIRLAYEACLARIAGPRESSPDQGALAVERAVSPSPDPGGETAAACEEENSTTLDAQARLITEPAQLLTADVAATRARLDAALAELPLGRERALEMALARRVAARGPWDPAALRVIVDRFDWGRFLRHRAPPAAFADPVFLHAVDVALQPPRPIRSDLAERSGEIASLSKAIPFIAVLSAMNAHHLQRLDAPALGWRVAGAILLLGTALFCAYGWWQRQRRMPAPQEDPVLLRRQRNAWGAAACLFVLGALAVVVVR